MVCQLFCLTACDVTDKRKFGFLPFRGRKFFKNGVSQDILITLGHIKHSLCSKDAKLDRKKCAILWPKSPLQVWPDLEAYSTAKVMTFLKNAKLILMTLLLLTAL